MNHIESSGHAWGTRPEDYKKSPTVPEIKGVGIALRFGKESSRNLVSLPAESLSWLGEDSLVPSRRVDTSLPFRIASVSSTNEVLNEASCSFTDQERSLGSALVADEADKNGIPFDYFIRIDYAGISAFIKGIGKGYETTYAYALSRTEDADFIIEELKSHGEWRVDEVDEL